MTTTFTPGPWHAGPHYKSDVESREGRIAECLPFGTPRAAANARLIAAAPELLELLRACSEKLTLMGGMICDPHFTDRHGDGPLMLALARRANELIARAEGL